MQLNILPANGMFFVKPTNHIVTISECQHQPLTLRHSPSVQGLVVLQEAGDAIVSGTVAPLTSFQTMQYTLGNTFVHCIWYPFLELLAWQRDSLYIENMVSWHSWTSISPSYYPYIMLHIPSIDVLLNQLASHYCYI